jgi:hypothetical protein
MLGDFPYLEVEPKEARKEVLLFCKYKKTLKGCPAPVYRRDTAGPLKVSIAR